MKYGYTYTKTRKCPCCDWTTVEHHEGHFEWLGPQEDAPDEAVHQIKINKTDQEWALGVKFHLIRVFQIKQERKITELQFQPFRDEL